MKTDNNDDDDDITFVLNINKLNQCGFFIKSLCNVFDLSFNRLSWIKLLIFLIQLTLMYQKEVKAALHFQFPFL